MADNIDYQHRLNKAYPTAADIKLGDTLQEIIAAYNDLATKFNAVLAKLDADVGVTDTNYAATQAATSTDLNDINQRA